MGHCHMFKVYLRMKERGAHIYFKALQMSFVIYGSPSPTILYPAMRSCHSFHLLPPC